MTSSFIQVPTVKTLLSDLLNKVEEELKKCVYLEYYAGSFQVKKGAMHSSIENQRQMARKYIQDKNNRLAIYDNKQNLICKIQPSELQVDDDSAGFFILIKSQECQETIQKTNMKEFFLSQLFKGRDQTYPTILRSLLKMEDNYQKRPSEKIIKILENYSCSTQKQIQSSQKFKLDCKTSLGGYNTSILQKKGIATIGYNLLLILAGGAGVGKTKTATVAAIEFLRKYNKKSVLCALTYAASKSLATHMLQQLQDIATYFKKSYKQQILLMEEFQNLVRLHKYNRNEDIPLLEEEIRDKIRVIQNNPKELNFLFHNGLVEQKAYFQQEKLLRYFSFNTQVLLSLIKLNEGHSILELLNKLDRVACKQGTPPQFHQMYLQAVRFTIKNTTILITNTARVPQINSIQRVNERFTPELGILDEARQATMIDTYCLLSLDIKRLILLGDEYQLSLDKNNHYNSLQISPLEILDYSNKIPKIILTHNYRMSKEIQEFNQVLTYRNRLCTGNQRFTTGKHQNYFFKKPIFMVTHNVAEQFISQYSDHGHFNQGQIKKIKEIVQHFINWKADFKKIAILTFYKGQVQKLHQQFARQIAQGLTVNTTDAFQGGQKDYVILSCVRSNKQHNIGYTHDRQRINVAFTRPRRGLIIVGDPLTLVQGNKYNIWRKTWRFLHQRSAIVNSPQELFIHPVKLLEKFEDEFEDEFDDFSTEDHFDEEDRAEIDRMTPQQIHQYFQAERLQALQGNGFDQTVFLPFIASNSR